MQTCDYVSDVIVFSSTVVLLMLVGNVQQGSGSDVNRPSQWVHQAFSSQVDGALAWRQPTRLQLTLQNTENFRDAGAGTGSL